MGVDLQSTATPPSLPHFQFIKPFKLFLPLIVGAVGLEPTTALRTLLIKSEKLHQLSYAPEIKPT